ncbi:MULTISPECIES: hypothetical protein [Xanthobacter]|uniref:hypothetical protein n=1 Tax=Xanthobacter TaxID=279 RepID=UPI00045E6CC2|nr:MULTISPECIES: hypothetical protein [Xanthobacter]MCL8384405.1 hypothetical protein [Xanthobacter aminoxidans]
MTEDSEAAQIAPQAIARWTGLPEDAPLRISLTRADLDNLLLGLRTLAIGQSELAAALVAHINQDPGECHEAVLRAGDLSRAAFGRINGFAGAIMAGAVPEG